MTSTPERLPCKACEDIADTAKARLLKSGVGSLIAADCAAAIRSSCRHSPATAERWVSVEERLPDKERKMLVTNNINARDAHGEMSHVWLVIGIYANSEDGNFCAFDGDLKLRGITHWQYALPPAPGGEGRGGGDEARSVCGDSCC